ncbi:adenine deaminase [Bacillus gobiensis]|uniref:adenine deaminase n=1 Tax=Bacillus gobiensis TaxID=1441095 RepID=UPI003D1AB490
MNKESLKHRIKAASHAEIADLVIKNGKILDVFNLEWMDTDIAVTDGIIVGLGTFEGREVIDAGGQKVVPGFIDGHVHIESSMVTPLEYSKAVLPHGVTTVITDPHEIANVSGEAGIRFMMEEAERAPVSIFFMLPSSVPATKFEASGARLTADKLSPFYSSSARVLGLAEVMDYVSVKECDDDMITKLADAQGSGKKIDGHMAGLPPELVNIYRTATVTTDHEVTTAEEALERIKRGMYVMLREGSVAKNLKQVLPAVTAKNARRFFYCTDDKHLDEIMIEGSVDHQIRLSIKEGLDPLLAYQMASLNAAECYGLSAKGAVAPGYDADFVFLSDVENVTIERTFVKGIEAETAADGREPVEIPERLLNTVKTPSLLSEDLEIHLKNDQPMKVIEVIPNHLETKLLTEEPSIQNGLFQADISRDLLKIATIERHSSEKEVGLGIVKGFGLKKGAIAATISHDSHHFISVGTNNQDMLHALSVLKSTGGGITVCLDGMEVQTLALPISGLLSDQPADAVSKQLELLNVSLRKLGFNGNYNPFLTLSFLALPVIPEIKMTSKGLFDVRQFRFVPVQ